MKVILLTAVLALIFMGAGHAAASGLGALPKQPMDSEVVLVASPGGSLLTASSQQAADALQSVLEGRVSKESPVLVATMVQLDDLQKSSTLGRVVMQQVASRLSQYGYRIVESRLRQDMAIKPYEGEFMLTRDVAKLMQAQYAAQAVLVGSYVENSGAVYFSLRLIRLDDGSVVGGYEYHLPNRGEVRSLLRQDKNTTADSDPEWSNFNKREVAYSSNGVALPPVKSFGASRSAAPIFKGDVFNGGAAPVFQPQANSPVFTPPHRMADSQVPSPNISPLGPPKKITDAQVPVPVMPEPEVPDQAIR